MAGSCQRAQRQQLGELGTAARPTPPFADALCTRLGQQEIRWVTQERKAGYPAALHKDLPTIPIGLSVGGANCSATECQPLTRDQRPLPHLLPHAAFQDSAFWLLINSYLGKNNLCFLLALGPHCCLCAIPLLSEELLQQPSMRNICFHFLHFAALGFIIIFFFFLAETLLLPDPSQRPKQDVKNRNK